MTQNSIYTLAKQKNIKFLKKAFEPEKFVGSKWGASQAEFEISNRLRAQIQIQCLESLMEKVW